MHIFQVFALMSLLTVSVIGCSNGLKQRLGLVASAPNEFMVVSGPALVIPPNFTLRPPRTPGDVASTRENEQKAMETLTGRPVDPIHKKSTGSPISTGEKLLLENAHATHADDSIRETIDSENAPRSAQSASGKPGAKKPGFFKRLFSSTKNQE